MANPLLTIWCNHAFPAAAAELLRAGIGPHRLVLARALQHSNLASGTHDAELDAAEIALGQPPADAIAAHAKLRWVHLTSAGYDRYDRADVRAALRQRGIVVTNSSAVYAGPCAEHALAMILAHARRLPDAWREQHGERAWPSAALRTQSRLLERQTVVLLGYGAIGRRLAELLAPHRVRVIAVRRSVRGDEAVETLAASDMAAALAVADHVVNVLPAGTAEGPVVTAERVAQMRAGAVFYNVGRGSTVDQRALRAALQTGHLAGAYLDVTSPEPLPPDDPLWTTPNCWITPHTAGGDAHEMERLVSHFVANLARYVHGEPLRDVVIGP